MDWSRSPSPGATTLPAFLISFSCVPTICKVNEVCGQRMWERSLISANSGNVTVSSGAKLWPHTWGSCRSSGSKNLTLIAPPSRRGNTCQLPYKISQLDRSSITGFVTRNAARAMHSAPQKKPRHKHCCTAPVNTEHAVTHTQCASAPEGQ